MLFERLFFRRVLRIATREKTSMLLRYGTACAIDPGTWPDDVRREAGVCRRSSPAAYRIFSAYLPAEPARRNGVTW